MGKETKRQIKHEYVDEQYSVLSVLTLFVAGLFFLAVFILFLWFKGIEALIRLPPWICLGLSAICIFLGYIHIKSSMNRLRRYEKDNRLKEMPHDKNPFV